MKFFSTRELCSTPEDLWEQLAQDGEVVITNDGKPSAVMINVTEEKLEETIRTIRQAKAMIAFHAMRMQAAKQGFFSEKEIEDEIAAVRKAQKE